jgi:hypothetical protein
MAFTFQSIVVDNEHDREGLLLLRDGALRAVLVRLCDTYDDPALTDCWFVEASFASDGAAGKVFKTVHHAVQWFEASAGSVNHLRPCAA